jgi:hypothetical protein
MGFGLVIGFNEYLPILTTSNHSAVANSHTLHFTVALTVFSVGHVFPGFLETIFYDVVSSASVFTSLLAGDCLATNSALLHNGLQNGGSCAFRASARGDGWRRHPMGLSLNY